MLLRRAVFLLQVLNSYLVLILVRYTCYSSLASFDDEGDDDMILRIP